MTSFNDRAAAVARALIDIRAVGIRADSPITFKSGIQSPVYVDNRTLPFHPKQWRVVMEGFATLVKDKTIPCDVLAGVAVGGVPHASALGYIMDCPSVFIRKEAKEHGKAKRVEGGDIRGKRVLLVEDLVTTGSSSLSAVEALRAEGAQVDDSLAIVTYGFAQAVQNFSAAKVTLHSLTSFPVILDQGVAMGRFSAQDKAIVEAWLKDPHGWRA